MRLASFAVTVVLAGLLSSCGAAPPEEVAQDARETKALPGWEIENSDAGEDTKMQVQVGETVFTATLEHNDAVDALVARLREGPVVVLVEDYAGFEKVGALGSSLPTEDVWTTTHAGDIVVYNGDQVVFFYGSNSWNYTKLGKIDDLTGWEAALGDGGGTVTLSLEDADEIDFS